MGLLPINLEAQLYLNVNSDFWNLHTLQKSSNMTKEELEKEETVDIQLHFVEDNISDDE